WDGTVAAQKVLSAVYRLWKERGQRFGAAHIIDILRGKKTPRVDQHRHDELSVFGVGADLSERDWRGVLRQLIAQSLLAVDHDGFSTLTLTEGSRAVLKGERTLMLRREVARPAKTRESSSRARGEVIELPAEAQPCFLALRAWRAAVAKDHGVPAYVIFHDATLREIARSRPGTMDELARIQGVGVRKLEAYGQAILEQVEAN